MNPFALFEFVLAIGGIEGCYANGCPVKPGPLRWVCRCKDIVEHVAAECERIYSRDTSTKGEQHG